jgi:predicted RND superfamily exporter protein
MIGFIAGAGIVVRNSIILVDFIELRLRQGMTLADAVVDAGAVRFRPMMLTAAAVIVGSIVILFDPIFQGLAISLMAGEVASLFLSRMTVPVLFYLSERKKHEEQPIESPVVEELPLNATEISGVDTGAEANNGSLADVLLVESPAQTEEIAVESSQPTNSKTVRADRTLTVRKRHWLN